jgi:Fe2+ or Zn2+ uptake regulation protein/Fe2+ transport system protein FeoA
MDDLAVVSEGRFRAAGKRMTNQRRLLLRILAEAGGHLDAREVYDRARQRDRHLSLATVYRTLSSLKEAGVVRELHLDEEHHHYELDVQDGHSHLVCLGCGRVIEVDSQAFAEAAQAIGQASGFTVASAQVELTGYCAACREDADARRSTEPKCAEGDPLTLGCVPSGGSVRVRALSGGSTFRSRLACLGFTPGASLRMLQNSGHGPVLVALRDTRVALGRGEASQVLVEWPAAESGAR